MCTHLVEGNVFMAPCWTGQTLLWSYSLCGSVVELLCSLGSLSHPEVIGLLPHIKYVPLFGKSLPLCPPSGTPHLSSHLSFVKKWWSLTKIWQRGLALYTRIPWFLAFHYSIVSFDQIFGKRLLVCTSCDVLEPAVPGDCYFADGKCVLSNRTLIILASLNISQTSRRQGAVLNFVYPVDWILQLGDCVYINTCTH